MNEPLIFIHGLIHGLSHLEPPAVFPSRATLVPNLVGYGNNRAAPGQISVDAQVRFLQAFIDREGLNQAHFIGHSVGGAIAMLFAAAHPDRVASVVNVEGNFTLRDAFWSSKLARMQPDEVEAILSKDRHDVAAWLQHNSIAPTAQRVFWAKTMFDLSPASTVHAMAKS